MRTIISAITLLCASLTVSAKPVCPGIPTITGIDLGTDTFMIPLTDIASTNTPEISYNGTLYLRSYGSMDEPIYHGVIPLDTVGETLSSAACLDNANGNYNDTGTLSFNAFTDSSFTGGTDKDSFVCESSPLSMTGFLYFTCK